MTASSAKPAVRDVANARRTSQRLVILLSVLTVLPLISLSTCVLVLVGMLPTIVALIADRSPNRHAATAVGGLNLAGLAPFLLHLWFDAPGMTGAISVLTDAFSMTTMYAAAAAGWLLFLGVPALFRVIDAAAEEQRIERMLSRQRDLRDEWGSDVVGAEAEAEADPKDEGPKEPEA